MDLIKRISIIILLILTLSSFDYQPQIREPFEDYKVEQPYKAPSKPQIDWNSLDYNDPTLGWYYKLLWYMYGNPNEIEPWLKPMPIEDDLPFILIICGFFLAIKLKNKNKFA